MKRKIIFIDESLCNGCGACVKGCHEGALQMIDGKARIVSELYCDGLGACIGECPVGAITIEEREAEPYDEMAVMERISPKGAETVLAHLKHLKEHNETVYLEQGLEYIKRNGLDVDTSSICTPSLPKVAGGCPGSKARVFTLQPALAVANLSAQAVQSQLSHWPVQLHLLNPLAGYFTNADVVLAADCTAFAYANFHNEILHGKKLAIACPKLDSNKENYVEKLSQMMDTAKINTLTVVIMEVPCCNGLMQIAQMAAQKANRKVPVKLIVISVDGNKISDEWL
ncbi:MAG: ATP-binding protein [Marinifilaceae bacterium]